jgi:NitT/TauT family transport system substrate-binding protein/sulfonate transport system substrate-binding protein
MKVLSLTKRLVVGIALLGTAALVVAQERMPIRIGCSPAIEHLAVFYAQEAGLFAKHGLDPKVTLFQTGVEMINGLTSGGLDVVNMASIPLMSGVSRGMPLTLIGHLYGDAFAKSYAPFSIVTGPKMAAKVGDVKSLAGKKVGLPRGSAAEGYGRNMLKQHGVADSEVTLVNMPPSNMIAALTNGDIDAVVVWEPWATLAAAQVKGAERITRGGCSECYDPGTIIATRSTVRNNPEILRRYMLAFSEAQQWVRQNRDGAAVKLAARWITGVDETTLATALKGAAYDQRLTRNSIEGYKTKLVPFLHNIGAVKSPVDVDALLDPQFITHAAAQAPQFFTDLKPLPADLQIK